jgi:hypothetical protein
MIGTVLRIYLAAALCFVAEQFLFARGDFRWDLFKCGAGVDGATKPFRQCQANSPCPDGDIAVRKFYPPHWVDVLCEGPGELHPTCMSKVKALVPSGKWGGGSGSSGNREVQSKERERGAL